MKLSDKICLGAVILVSATAAFLIEKYDNSKNKYDNNIKTEQKVIYGDTNDTTETKTPKYFKDFMPCFP